MDFDGFIYEVSTYLSRDFEVRRQLVSNFVEEKKQLTIGSYLNS